ncbi:hypothetical protein DFH28DRAFT_959027 [Melampsora americana]|nr:hypothetical protein DFH28DRAFT_959027 [Melampsora americana]
MHHPRHLLLRSFVIFWNIYFASTLVIPCTHNAKHSTSAQFARRALAATHLAESSTSELKEMVSVGSSPTTLKSHTFSSTSPLKNEGLSSGGLEKSKITPLEVNSVSPVGRESLLSDEQLDKFERSTTSIRGTGKEFDQVKSSRWKNQLPKILKLWWKAMINQISLFQRSIRSSFGKIVRSKSYTANPATKTLHESLPDSLTINHHETMGNQATKTPRDHSNEDNDIFHDDLSDLQENPTGGHAISSSMEPQTTLKENHVPTEAQAALKENLSTEEGQVLPNENYSPTQSQAPLKVLRPTFHDTSVVSQDSGKSTDVSLHQTQLAIAELAWNMIQRGEKWQTVLRQIYPDLNKYMFKIVRSNLQKSTDDWKILYESQKIKAGVGNPQDHKTLREALDNPLDTVTRKGYDNFLASLKRKLANNLVKKSLNEKVMETLQTNVAQQLKEWYQPLK